MRAFVRFGISLLAAMAVAGSALAADLRIGVAADITSMDPHAVNLNPNNNIGWHVFDALVNVDRDARIVPGLAESWEVSPDAKNITLHLRKGVKFANVPPVNGRDFTAQDAKWNLEYYSRSGQFKDKKLPVNQFDWMYEGMTAVETPDPQTVVVRFNKPFVPFVNYMATEVMTMGAREVFEQDGFNMPMVHKGMVQSAKAVSTLSVYQESKIRWLHKRLGDWVEG